MQAYHLSSDALNGIKMQKAIIDAGFNDLLPAA